MGVLHQTKNEVNARRECLEPDSSWGRTVRRSKANAGKLKHGTFSRRISNAEPPGIIGVASASFLGTAGMALRFLGISGDQRIAHCHGRATAAAVVIGQSLQSLSFLATFSYMHLLVLRRIVARIVPLAPVLLETREMAQYSSKRFGGP